MGEGSICTTTWVAQILSHAGHLQRKFFWAAFRAGVSGFFNVRGFPFFLGQQLFLT